MNSNSDATKDQTSTAMVKTAVLEVMGHPRGERTIARGKRGRYVNKVQAMTEIATKQTIDLLQEKDASGKTKFQLLKQHILEVAMSATDEKSLIGLAKILSTFEDSAGVTAQRDNLLKDEHETNPIKIVIISAPEGLKAAEPEKAEKTRPSWIEAEILSTNPPQE
jgi:hypothetical protein